MKIRPGGAAAPRGRLADLSVAAARSKVGLGHGLWLQPEADHAICINACMYTHSEFLIQVLFVPNIYRRLYIKAQKLFLIGVGSFSESVLS